MHRSTSYRKPVPVYVPSPPPSPAMSAPMQLAFTLENSEPMPHSSPDWRTVLEQASKKRRVTGDSTSISDRSLEKLGQDPIPERKVPSLLVESPDGQKIPIEESNYTPLYAPSTLPPSPERHAKRKLHQYYRPPTPPLAAHTRKRRTVDSTPNFFHSCELPCPMSDDARQGVCPEPRRMPSMTAPSFSTTVTQSPSFKTEKTYLSFGPSELSTLWSGNMDMGLHDLPKPVGLSRTPARMGDAKTNSPRSPWRGRIGTWGASLGMSLRRFTTMFIC
ncbi:hypothetical protein FPV67DRAFT_418281 [Lyophyllum atratum]|nr:hypothetical protein FPV67DRAFT_418281 [Lyophyllum atratum]